ncbi:MAG: meiotically up-regulated gene 157 protein [Benjaminiella poitrasii]|nr:MAG: meiotically up-regulated gene 157 protein [Benjaminiella poitrasii]
MYLIFLIFSFIFFLFSFSSSIFFFYLFLSSFRNKTMSTTGCPDYSDFSKAFHEPGSGGSFNLPFQRPTEVCRKFASSVIESVINNVTSKMVNLDLARLFTNSFPNTLDTTISKTACILKETVNSDCQPLSYIITGDINAMWLRDSANQLLPYLNYIKQDGNLKRLFLGAIYMQAHFINIDPYSNAFNEPIDINELAKSTSSSFNKRSVVLLDGVFENKWEIDSLASFMSLSYQYWNQSGDDSFVNNTVWINAVESIIETIKHQQEPTFNETTGQVLDTNYAFSQTTDRPTETQFINGRGQPVRHTGMVKSLFRPSDDATVYPFFIPGNAMLSVELDHLSQLLSKSSANQVSRVQQLASKASILSKEIKEAIYKYGLIEHPTYGKIFAYEVDGYGSSLIMDDANIPSLLSLSLIGFLDQNDQIYQNTRRLVLSHDNPYYFSGPRGSGIGGPHIGLEYAWPMSQIVRILTSSDDKEIEQALDVIVASTDNTGLIHESINVYRQGGGDNNRGYTRSWFSWANGLFGQAILKVMNDRPHLLTSAK